MFPAQAQHSLDKILPVDAEHPCNPDNEIFIEKFLNRKLPLIFCLSVSIQRLPYVIRLPWTFSRPVKHIICADVHQADVKIAADFSYVTCPVCIDLPA